MSASLTALKKLAVGTARRAPFRWVCQIEVDHGRPVLPIPAQKIAGDAHGYFETLKGGSGLLISPRHVLTCAHILADRQSASHRPRRVSVSFASGARPNSTIWTARNVWFHPRSRAADIPDKTKRMWESISFDIGLIELASNDGVFPGHSMLADPRERFGWWGEAAPNYFMNAHRPPDWLGTRKVNVYGFPDPSTQLHWGFGAVSAVLRRDASVGRLHPLIRYAVSTGPGVSGGPVWTVDSEPMQRRLIGIHGGDWEREGGGALLLNADVIAFLRDHGVTSRFLEAADKAYANPAAQ